MLDTAHRLDSCSEAELGHQASLIHQKGIVASPVACIPLATYKGVIVSITHCTTADSAFLAVQTSDCYLNIEIHTWRDQYQAACLIILGRPPSMGLTECKAACPEYSNVTSSPRMLLRGQASNRASYTKAETQQCVPSSYTQSNEHAWHLLNACMCRRANERTFQYPGSLQLPPDAGLTALEASPTGPAHPFHTSATSAGGGG